MAAQKIGVAIIGSGIFVTEEHLPAVQACDLLELKAIYSRTLKSAQTVSEGLNQVDLYSENSDKSLADLLVRSDIQAVIIALPIPVAPKFIKQALEAGKHTLAEKPLAKDVATAVELLNWYDKNIDANKVFCSIAENWRYIDAFAKAAEHVQSFGKVQAFNTRIHFYIPDGWKYTKTEWRRNPEFQGGYILDSGVHMVAGIRKMLGPDTKIKKVSGFATAQAAHLPPVDTVATTFQLDNASAGTLSLSFGTKFTDGVFEMACEGGTVSADIFKSEVTSKAAGGEQKVESAKDDVQPVTQEVAAWAKSLKAGVPEKRLSPWEALADLEVVEAILQSGGNSIELRYQL